LILVPEDPYRFHYATEPVMPLHRRARNQRNDSREAQQLINRILQEGKDLAEEMRMKDQEVKRMEIQEDEQCCICFDNITQNQNLTFCKFGCGRNFHMKCADHYADHKISSKTDATCPLCRKTWGPNVRDRFK